MVDGSPYDDRVGVRTVGMGDTGREPEERSLVIVRQFRNRATEADAQRAQGDVQVNGRFMEVGWVVEPRWHEDVNGG